MCYWGLCVFVGLSLFLCCVIVVSVLIELHSLLLSSVVMNCLGCLFECYCWLGGDLFLLSYLGLIDFCVLAGLFYVSVVV